MLCRESFCDEPRVFQFVEVAFWKPDREGAYGLGIRGHERDHRARVKATGEERPKRDVAHEADAHSLIELGPKPIEGFWLSDLGFRLEGQSPVRLLIARIATAERQE